MKAVGNSVIGMRRTNNEDAIYINEQKNLYLVADGMGGCNAGEVASSTAISAFVEAMENAENGETLDKMMSAIAQCNKKVYQKSRENVEFLDMGTTLVAVTVENEKMFIVHVGDSRVYLFRENNLQQITTDHSYVMELVKIGSITREECPISMFFPRFIAVPIYSLALQTASSSLLLPARNVAMAEERVHPVPCRLRLSILGLE